MADKSLPPDNLWSPAEPASALEADTSAPGRRAFFRRAVGVGIPVILATVRGRTVYARQLSGCGSIAPSGCTTGGLVTGEDISQPKKKPKKPF
jgi:hypothetical protein